jgi:hypothetical protein
MYIYLKSTPYIYQHDGGAHYCITLLQSPNPSLSILYLFFIISPPRKLKWV